MMLRELLKRMTKEEKQSVEHTAADAAVAIANFWDALRQLEVKYDVEFDGTMDLLEYLASECDVPASHSTFQRRSAKYFLDEILVEKVTS